MVITEGPVDPRSRLFVGRTGELKTLQTWLASTDCVGAVMGARHAVDTPGKGPTQAMMMEAVRRHVQENFDDVGDAFAKEARDIHEGRSEARGIYGQATALEVRDLLRDGVPVAPLPPEPPKKTDLN